MARRLTQRGLERRREIVEWSTAAFAERGYHTTSVAEIVTGLGVGKGVFYWDTCDSIASQGPTLQETWRVEDFQS